MRGAGMYGTAGMYGWLRKIRLVSLCLVLHQDRAPRADGICSWGGGDSGAAAPQESADEMRGVAVPQEAVGEGGCTAGGRGCKDARGAGPYRKIPWVTD
ncbi:hypothetical protein PSAB_04210 [Paenibacillus sabinae T27]|uniref:Uncharacterized protein n=2 Tax=Paenibacillus sabinae TaxID=365617 RepID=X4ZTV2_9BACL|nr:hypothetical protein PSAB_04210 [Paenibacillus sabinae T27]